MRRPDVSPAARPHPSRRALLLMGLASAATLGCAGPSLAVGRSVDVDVIDRDTGQVLEVHAHRGRHYIAGRPGARYAIRITNRSAERVLAVTAVDGINIVSGQTAAWSQTGYVFEPWQSYELTGWRKSDQQVAAFEFTSLPASYAARTGRPLDVGVIGVAVFRERPRPVLPAPPVSAYGSSDQAAESRASDASTASAAPAPGDSSARATTQRQEAARKRLGTGHGERETSYVSHTHFERASTRPDEIVSLQYDRFENLVAAGVIAGDRVGRLPRPFPRSRDTAGYVPDPPTY
ncbi:MAG TPA: hypothetical protein VGE16_03545 [Albitalea sp.]